MPSTMGSRSIRPTTMAIVPSVIAILRTFFSWLLLHERHISPRLTGAVVMIAGGGHNRPVSTLTGMRAMGLGKYSPPAMPGAYPDYSHDPVKPGERMPREESYRDLFRIPGEPSHPGSGFSPGSTPRLPVQIRPFLRPSLSSSGGRSPLRMSCHVSLPFRILSGHAPGHITT